jgi:hypothetical protein
LDRRTTLCLDGHGERGDRRHHRHFHMGAIRVGAIKNWEQ